MIYTHDTLEVERINISKKKLDEFKQKCLKDIDEALTVREDTLEEDWKRAEDQYYSSMKRQGTYSDEYSQIDVPSTREFIEMALARYMNPIFQREYVYFGKPKRPEYQQFAGAITNFCDWVLNRDGVNFRDFVEMVLKQAMVYPKATVKVGHSVKTRKVKQFYHESDTGELKKGAYSNSVFIAKEEYITEDLGVFPTVIPARDFIHPIPTISIDSAPWVCHRIWRSKQDIKAMINRGVYDAVQVDGKKTIECIGDPSAPANAAVGLAVRNGKDESDEGNGASDGVLYEILEIYTTMDEEEVIITIDRESSTVLRFIKNFYNESQRPFVTWNYERTLNSIDGVSLCFTLEPYHVALSACLNQRLDAASKSLEQILFVSDSLGLGKYIKKDNHLPGGAYQVSNLGDIKGNVQQFMLSQPFTQMENLEADLRQHMQKLAGLTDYNAGIEQIQRPTATGQMALIEEGRQPQYNRMESFRGFLSQVMMMIIARYRQFYPKNITYYLQSKDQEEAMVTHQVLTWPEEYWRDQVVVETVVSSQTMNQDMKKQENLALVDKMPEVLERLMAYAEAVSTPSPTAPVASVFLDFYFKQIVQPWLESFGVPGRKELAFDSAQMMWEGVQNAIDQLTQEIQQLQMSNEDSQSQIQTLTDIVDHLTRTFFQKTGEYPPPPPRSRSTGQAPQQTGMGVGSEVLGAGSPEEMA